MCHPRKEGDNHAKGLATSSADSGKILARFRNVIGEEEKRRDVEEERGQKLILIYCHFYIYPGYLVSMLLIFPFSLGLFYS